MNKILVLALLLALSACGFQLRGDVQLPFKSLYVDGGASVLGVDLQRALSHGSNVQVVDSQAEAQAVLQVLGESREKRILSIGSNGRVSEYVLFYRLSFRLHDGKGKALLPAQSLELKRDISFSDAQVLAKEQEEAMLYRDMQGDAVQQVIRRLNAVRM